MAREGVRRRKRHQDLEVLQRLSTLRNSCLFLRGDGIEASNVRHLFPCGMVRLSFSTAQDGLRRKRCVKSPVPADQVETELDFPWFPDGTQELMWMDVSVRDSMVSL